MTAINILRQSKAVHLISDGASYDEHQRPTSFGPKVFPLPHINAAIGIRGPTIALPLIAHLVGHAATSYNELKANIVAVLKRSASLCDTILGRCSAPFEVAIAGMSEGKGPDAYVVCSRDWSVTDVPEIGFMPELPETVAYFARLLGKVTSTDDLVAAAFGIEVLEIQRKARMGPHLTCHVGGFAQLTSVDATGIQTRILRRWPDEVGQFLDSSPLEAQAGVIGALGIKSLSIADNAATVPVVQILASDMSIATSGTDFFNFNMSIDTTGLSGKTIPVYASVTFKFLCSYAAAGTQPTTFQLFVNGSQVDGFTIQCVAGLYILSMSGARSITGTGGTVSVPIIVRGFAGGGADHVQSNACVFAMAAKR